MGNANLHSARAVVRPAENRFFRPHCRHVRRSAGPGKESVEVPLALDGLFSAQVRYGNLCLYATTGCSAAVRKVRVVVSDCFHSLKR